MHEGGRGLPARHMAPFHLVVHRRGPPKTAEAARAACARCAPCRAVARAWARVRHVAPAYWQEPDGVDAGGRDMAEPPPSFSVDRAGGPPNERVPRGAPAVHGPPVPKTKENFRKPVFGHPDSEFNK